MVKNIEQVLGSRSLIRVLWHFMMHPSARISQTELESKTKLARATLIRSVRMLADFSLIVEQRIGATKLCSLNVKNPIVRQLKIINTLALLDVDGIKKKFGCEVYLYGSAARGEDIETSDIDLLVIGKVKKEKLIGEVERLSKKLGREVKIQVFGLPDWLALAKNDPAFYERVEKDKVLL